MILGETINWLQSLESTAAAVTRHALAQTSSVTANATVTARIRFEKTQNVADGNLPVAYCFVMTFSWT